MFLAVLAGTAGRRRAEPCAGAFVSLPWSAATTGGRSGGGAGMDVQLTAVPGLPGRHRELVRDGLLVIRVLPPGVVHLVEPPQHAGEVGLAVSQVGAEHAQRPERGPHAEVPEGLEPEDDLRVHQGTW